jgi:hypothetical protein
MQTPRPKKAPHRRSLPGVAKANGVCNATLYNEIGRGYLEITKIGARTIITEEQEAAWLKRRRKSA